MHKLKLLHVEDAPDDIETCRATVTRYCKENEREINLVQVGKLQDALEKLDNSFDGAIIDLRLDTKQQGNEVIKAIKSKYRIPVAVMTGTPQDAEKGVPYLGVFTKGETGYDELLDLFYIAFDTGITKILGGRGYLEDAMSKVYWNNILPRFEDWKTHKKNGKETEKALLRFIINHIVELVDLEAEKYFPDEMYISPVISDAIKTGGIVNKRGVDQSYIILSPACDLALHKGNFKTDQIMVCFIEKIDMHLVRTAREDMKITVLETDDEASRNTKEAKIEKAKGTLEQLQRNNYPYFHYLPNTSIFKGGFVNFRKIETFLPSEFKRQFEDPFAQISSAFTKDIVARFSSYYARQGQPDFDLDNCPL